MMRSSVARLAESGNAVRRAKETQSDGSVETADWGQFCLQGFHHHVAGWRQSEPLVSRLRGGVVFFDIQPQTGNVRRRGGFGLQVLDQLAEDPLASKVGMHIDTLQPPNLAVAPVAPFKRVHHLADHSPVEAGDEVTAVTRIRQDRPHTELHGRTIELLAFGLGRQTTVEVNDDLFVSRIGLSDDERHHRTLALLEQRIWTPFPDPRTIISTAPPF